MQGPVVTSMKDNRYLRGTAAALAGIPVSNGCAAEGKVELCLGGWLQNTAMGVRFAVPAPAEVNEVLTMKWGTVWH